MRRKDREITKEDAFKILKNAEYGVLSMSTLDNIPYGIPLSFCVIENEIYFHCAVEGQKIDYIANNNSVSFCVVGHTELLPEKFSAIFESTIVSGTIHESFGEEKQKGLEALIKKYSPTFIEKGIKYIEKEIGITKVFKIKIEKITGKARR